ncbi:MAG: hypothetical protein IJE18_08810 [Bacteroidaceae bacterium]|nr:radical SAM protein [Bacteroidales bacterium]MBQ2980191.1 hypothetical protein [Bacteroidaceae bacterium]
MIRYAQIDKKFPREFVLLQGTGCRWGRCTFCDYHTDTSTTPYTINREVLSQVSGKHGVLDVINSGSGIELDHDTISLLQQIVVEKGIKTIWFEMHYMYRHKLQEFARQFAPAQVKFRCGIESFDGALRQQWNKGIPLDVTAEDVAKYFDGVCLLCCTIGDSTQRIVNDIATARRHFEYTSVNVFNNNSTAVKQDVELARWFRNEIYPMLVDDERIEVLIENTDLGVG